ncbi:MAG TPA: hypothetical protein VFN09_05900 [Rhodanobacteraceae bacterium]|nr:hypothetical protein [Rhodanobacteraceae bacterium]
MIAIAILCIAPIFYSKIYQKSFIVNSPIKKKLPDKPIAVAKPAATNTTTSILLRITPESSSSNEVVKTNVNLPPDENPWALTYKLLDPMAENGNMEASRRLYHDTYQCLRFHALPSIIDAATAEFNSPASSSSTEVSSYASSLDQLNSEIASLTRMCSSTNSAELKAALPSILRTAALLGVRGAAECYVSGQMFGYSQSPAGLAMASEYRDAATQIIQSSLGKGDWRMLHLLTNAFDESSKYASSWIPPLLGNNPSVMYALNRLELIGARGQEANEIQDRLQDIAARRGLSQQQVHSLDHWAEQMYANYFANKPRGDMTGGVCNVGVNPG